MTNFLSRYLLKLHADARIADRRQALLGALGVGAFAYPHQVENVERIVTDTSCRHLLADEVGLGKTVQAMMVLRALVEQREQGLKAALIVPDDLVEQWQLELFCRSQVGREGVVREPRADVTEDDDTTGEVLGPGKVWLDLCRPALLSTGALTFTAAQYDLLIVDEYSRLTQAIRDQIVQAGRVIPNLLLLTATPALHDERSRRELFTLLEPNIARQAAAQDTDILELLTAREQAAERYIRGEDAEPPGNMAEPGEARRYYQETHSLFRRVIRTRRIDYPEALPQRRYAPIVVPPTDGDVRRVDATRKYIAAAASEDFQVKGDLLLQVACRSPDSLGNRLTTLRRPSSTLVEAGKVIDDAVRDQGDAKLDALIDHLQATFRNQPEARILVVVEDNPSVDYVAKALEKLLQVRVARKRRSARQLQTDIDVHLSELRETLEPFETGTAPILVAADIASEGHNFQFATELVFYVLPWDPQAVDQWIGRLDRLGGNGPPGQRTVKITPIVTQGSIEAKILDVYEAAGIFEGGIVFDEDEWRVLAQAIDRAAYGGSKEWRQLLDDALHHKTNQEGWRRLSSFPLDDRTQQAREKFKAMRERRYAVPLAEVSQSGRVNWFRERELAAERLLSLSKRLDVLDVRRQSGEGKKLRYETVGYPRKAGGPEILVPEIDERPGAFQALIWERSALLAPPIAKIKHRRLHFFDHGNSLHDSLVDSFRRLNVAGSSDVEFAIKFPEGHRYSALRGKHIVLMTALAQPELPPVDMPAILSAVPSGESTAEREAMSAFIRRLHEDFHADQRWFANICGSKFYLLAGCTSQDGLKVLKAAPFTGWDLNVGDLPQQVSERRITDEATRTKVRGVISDLNEVMAARLSDHLSSLTKIAHEASSLRRFKLIAEGEEATQSFNALYVREDNRGGNLAPDHARRRGARLAADLSAIALRVRTARLDDAVRAVSSFRFADQTACVLKVH